jgi:regulatory protein
MGEATRCITRIEPQKKNKKRLNVYLDGCFAFGLDEGVVLAHHLREGDALDERSVDRILLAEEKGSAKQKGLSLLSYRPRSTEELKKKLLEKGFSENVVAGVITDFLRVGLLNDREFALALARSRMNHKPMAKRLLMRELFLKGIDGDVAKSVVEEVYDGLTEVEVACQLVRKKIDRFKGDARMRKRITDFLYRRGFHWDVINEALREEGWEQEH